MKAVLALVALCVVGINAIATNGGGVPSSNALTVTAGTQATASNFVFTVIDKPTSYVADGSVAFQATINATWTGVLPNGVAPTGSGAFSGGTTVQFDSSCTVGGATAVSYFGRDGGFITYKVNSNVQLTQATTYTFTATFKYPQVVVGTAAFTFTATSPFVPANQRTTIANTGAFVLVPATSVNNVGANLTIGGTVAASGYSVKLVFTAATPQAVAWVTTASKLATGTTLSFSVDDFGTLAAQTGSWCGDYFIGGATSGIDLPTATALTLVSVTVTSSFGSTTFGAGSAFLAGQNTYTLTTGEADVTAPTCASALFALPLDVATVDVPVSKGFVLTCTDNTGGSGIEYSGAWLRAVAGSITYDYSASATTAIVPPYYSGSISVIGAYAIDGAGNGVVYGTSGAVGCAATICGGGGSSSSSVVSASIAVVIACILAVLAL